MAQSTTSTSSSATSLFGDWLGGKRCSASLVKGNNGQTLGYQVKDDIEHPLFFVPNVEYSKEDMAAIVRVDESQHRLSLYARKGWFGNYYLEAKASG